MITQSRNLRRHKAFVHEGVRYQCDALPFTQSGHLKRHKASVHEGVRFVCDECDASPFYRAGDLKNIQELNIHVINVMILSLKQVT